MPANDDYTEDRPGSRDADFSIYAFVPETDRRETIVYDREIESIEPKEREVFMHWTNEWIERGKSEGRVQGLAQGRDEGKLELLGDLLRERLGSDVDTHTQQHN